jgi:hypothetical protein
MSERTETEIKSMTKEQNYMCGYRDGKSDVLDKIRAEIEKAAFDDVNGSKFIFVNRVNQIIDKYKTESEEETADGKTSICRS